MEAEVREMARVKITVLKRLDPKAVFGEEVPIHPTRGEPVGVCERFTDGQEFIVEEDLGMPEGFCGWAWYDIFKDVSILWSGGNFPWAKEGEQITCCTDGIRPVSFKMKRME
jgi:uncharacterized repeat protein (TIGR04076 family)